MGLIHQEVRGHSLVRTALIEAIKKAKLPSALLFRGPEAVGKKLVALGMAQDLLCDKGPPACGSCGSCLRVFKRQHEGLLIVSNDELNLKLEDIQPIFDFLRLKLLGRARIVIIDNAQKLNIQASNRLLKTLEEPPPNTHFVLITSQDSALPLTIQSRCQIIRFGPLDEADQRTMIEAPSWAYKASQGRMDLLLKLSKESSEERKFAFNIFKGLITAQRNYIFPQFAQFAKDKEKTLEIFTFFEQFLRDLWVQNRDCLIHRDLEKEYAQLGVISYERLEDLWKEFEQVKKAVDGNADRTLNLENLWFRIQELQ